MLRGRAKSATCAKRRSSTATGHAPSRAASGRCAWSATGKGNGVQIWSDSQTALANGDKPWNWLSDKLKHVQNHLHFFRQYVKSGDIDLQGRADQESSHFATGSVVYEPSDQTASSSPCVFFYSFFGKKSSVCHIDAGHVDKCVTTIVGCSTYFCGGGCSSAVQVGGRFRATTPVQRERSARDFFNFFSRGSSTLNMFKQ